VGVSDGENPDQVARDTVRVCVACRCGEIAVMELSPADARRTAVGMLAAADGLDRVEDVQVRGEG
jgi:hypothetical protein